MAELKHKVALVQSERKSGGVKRADFATFATNKPARVSAHVNDHII